MPCPRPDDPPGARGEESEGSQCGPAWRTLDNGAAIDASGTLTAQPFNGALELEAILRNDPRVPRAVVSYLASYALGREMGPDDQCLLDTLSSGFSQDGYRMPALVTRVAAMDPMRQRRGAP